MLKTIDWFLIALVLGMCLFGLIAIANARATPNSQEESGIFALLSSLDTHYVILQSVWIAIGVALMAAVMLIDYKIYGELWFYIYIASVAVLLMVLLLSEGVEGVTAWFVFDLGDTVRMIQPAELCKIAIIITMAKLVSRGGGPLRRIRDLLVVLGYLAVPLAIVVLQSELGSVMVYLAIFLGILFLSGTNWKLLVGLVTTGALSLVPLWFLIGESRQNRIFAFIDPARVSADASYQVDQSMLAIGSGQLTGKGLFREDSMNQLSYVPVNHSDFIFAVTAEAVGFWGCLIIVIAYVVLIMRLFYLSTKVQDRFGSLIIVGVASMFLFQTFENIAMTMGLMPVTGIPLPFMSYGGSAMLTNLAAIGLVQNVLMRPQKTYLVA